MGGFAVTAWVHTEKSRLKAIPLRGGQSCNDIELAPAATESILPVLLTQMGQFAAETPVE